MKTLVELRRGVWVAPTSIDALVENRDGSTLVIFASGENLTIWAMTPDDILDVIASRLPEEDA